MTEKIPISKLLCFNSGLTHESFELRASLLIPPGADDGWQSEFFKSVLGNDSVWASFKKYSTKTLPFFPN